MDIGYRPTKRKIILVGHWSRFIINERHRNNQREVIKINSISIQPTRPEVLRGFNDSEIPSSLPSGDRKRYNSSLIMNIKFKSDQTSIEKRLTILLWCLSVSIILYFLTISSDAMQNNPESFAWHLRIKHFMNFCFIIFGGGFAYHIATELLKCPYNKSNRKLWGNIQTWLFLIVLGYFTTAVILILARMRQDAMGWLLAIFALIFCIFWAVFLFGRLALPLKELLTTSTQGSRGTDGERGP